MDPAIPVHSVVLVQPAAPEKLQPGEIVSYRSGSSVVIHRLVENHIVEGELVTKGDANAEPDPLKVEYAGVLGTVTAAHPVHRHLCRGSQHAARQAVRLRVYRGRRHALSAGTYKYEAAPCAETWVRLLRKNVICTKAGCTRLAKRVQ